ncbi:hypothetical protein Kpol_1002p46 [Vanderwaltozyma polyspora DSM 70294]|uniref:ATP-dependent RNA helicase MRH4, mitochondrial n=1 Tax=Vanderwaltozyma polyspora (strain ATCC 22028 / DSM 70294 / BCRC 21397 / CBS 2163 / NBRC 10782 / NRRL Y-8283 / UCD 57-17) TaxID=436907 RepID=MRH4_VANPO|nr:uncharacterized protein Kpol_1002p46 [Vanderwaltozyma polyspora DSM 70294]A7TE77.1 RecName: Full=ATP-dependent RNA helicase MRH4, mitochondrial; Flags: Precursor [Vanderwaltozyma polyspora DSM 70294]EDO19399.1 hypothetical protein Kpol_1002p46 [Vanderwaltozyma polyspora DSM 70294]
MMTSRLPSCFGLRFYAKRAATIRAKPSKLASSVGIGAKRSKKTVKKKGKEVDIFNYGKYVGLKERDPGSETKGKELLDKLSSFDQLKILPEVRNSIKNIIKDETLSKKAKESEDVIPSPIQLIAMKKLSRTLMDPKLQHHAIAAETGSGKTMAYLIPLFDYLKRQETEFPEDWEFMQDKAIIRSVIFLPTHELVDQVYNTVKKTENDLKFHVYKWDSGTKYPEIVEKLKNRIDILITTPAKLLNLFNIRMISRADRLLSEVKFVVLDEADTLLDKSWVEDTHRAIRSLPNTNHLLFCSATIPNDFNDTLERLFPNTIPITTPRLHKLPKSVDFKIIDSSINPFKGSKIKALAQTLYAIANDSSEPGFEKRCIVFTNEKKDVPYIVEKLKVTYGHDCIGLTSNDSVEERLEKIHDFITPPKPITMKKETPKIENEDSVEVEGSNITIGDFSSKTSVKNSNSESSLKVLVSTDLMARGLNFQGVRNLVLYDVPQTSIDLIHRVGRTARMQQRGRVFMITDKKTKSWAKALPKVIKKNMTLK